MAFAHVGVAVAEYFREVGAGESGVAVSHRLWWVMVLTTVFTLAEKKPS